MGLNNVNLAIPGFLYIIVLAHRGISHLKKTQCGERGGGEIDQPRDSNQGVVKKRSFSLVYLEGSHEARVWKKSMGLARNGIMLVTDG